MSVHCASCGRVIDALPNGEPMFCDVSCYLAHERHLCWRRGDAVWAVLVAAGIATDQYCAECEQIGEHAGNCLHPDNTADYEPSDADIRAYYDCDGESLSTRHAREWEDKHGRYPL